MRKESKKEKWSKPKLIIIARGKPEERVLTACKSGTGGGSTGSGHSGCFIDSQCHWNICSAISGT